VRELFVRARVDERPGFRSALRSRLLTQVGPVAIARRSTPWWAIRIPRFALAGVAVVAMLFGGTGLAAAGSLPGEPLFDVKRAAEEVLLAITFDDATRVERLADQASARIAELRRAQGAARDAAATESTRALERLAHAQRAGGPDAPASERADEARDQAEAVLRDLEQRLPAEAANGIRRAIEASGGADRGPRTAPTFAPPSAPAVVTATPDARPSALPTQKGPPSTPPARTAPERSPGARP
ncbi:MAG: DUF5667 domain-containing protein, partial [Chloroflexota bacterium]